MVPPLVVPFVSRASAALVRDSVGLLQVSAVASVNPNLAIALDARRATDALSQTTMLP